VSNRYPFDPEAWNVNVSGRVLAVDSRYPVLDPSTGRVLTAVPDCSDQDVDLAVRAALIAQEGWGRTPPRGRGAVVRKLAQALREHREELAMLDAHDGGFTLKMMRTDVDAAAELLEIFADMALLLGGDTVPVSEHLHFTTREPYGVVARIGAFNHPLFFAAGKVGAPLMAGNAVILKAPDQTPLSTMRFAEIASTVLPRDLVIAVSGRGQTAGRAIVRHPDIRRIGFIGSTRTGTSIQKDAAESGVKHVSLELGGKNAQIVFSDADIERAAQGAVTGMNFTWTAGQSCGSTSRLLVQRSIADAVARRVSELVDGIKVGDPLDDSIDMGPLASEEQYHKSLAAIDTAVAEGGSVMAGGTRPSDLGDEGWFVRPTVIKDVRAGGFLDQTEVFGPVLAVIPFDDEADAVRIANGVEYGLTASVWTNDIDRALRVSRAVSAGYVLVNSPSRHFWGLPFGGVKSSGIGREESVDELLSYTETKSTSIVFTQNVDQVQTRTGDTEFRRAQR
jgi:2-formylbenzoate dehydrogenase